MSTKSKDDEMGDRLQLVMELLEKRSKGEATNDEVETAVSSILSGMGGGIAGAASTTPSDDSRKRNAGTLAMPHPDESRIKEDMGNYDSSDDENADKSQPPKKRIRNEPEEYYEEEDENDEEIDDGRDDEEYQDTLSQIPLGKSGAQMMTTFGDGPKPVPESVSAALLGTRNCLQVAIWDARGLRRASKEDFSRARKSLGARRGGGEHTYGVDPNMLYRAITRNDKLAYDPKCGFDVEQLQKLFPEEMAAYWRWVDMRSEYESNSATDQPSIQDTDGDDKDDDGGENSESGADATETSNEPALAGQLQERAAHFDTRTMKMKKSWYLKFSKKRQGSFLPRGTRLKQSQAQIQWNKSQRGRRGRYTAGVWENMPAASVQFLHWAGFDPPALPPPDEVTTQALAFLAYNFLGKIVEKVIYYRRQCTLGKNGGRTHIIFHYMLDRPFTYAILSRNRLRIRPGRKNPATL